MKAQLKMHYINSKKSFAIFWSIMFAITIIGFAVSLYIRSRGYNGRFTINNTPAVVIFASLSSVVSYNETFPYVMNMGKTRKNFVLSFAAYNILLSLILTAFITILSLFESSVYRLLGFSKENIGQMMESFSVTEIFPQMVIYFAVTLAAAALSALIGGIYYKKGMMFLFGIGALIMLLMFIPGVRVSAFKAMEFIILDIMSAINPIIPVLASAAFASVCFMIIYPITRCTQIKR